MSVSKYNYTEECNFKPCPGDCDLCGILGDEDYEYYVDKYGAVIEEYFDEEGRNETY